MTLDIVQRTAAGAAIAAAIGAAAWRARSLSPSGAAAATVVGTAAIAAGWSWGALLIAYFVSSTLLSRAGTEAKARRTEGVVEKGGRRDAWQVVANGGAFAAAALLAAATGAPGWTLVGAGALAASAADTWATEIGTLRGGTPRSIVTGRRLATGMSGGVTLAGSLASVAASATLAILAVTAGWGRDAAVAALAGGVAGSAADSLLGATAQARRRCDRCDAPTERRVHSCGTPTRADGGFAWLGNDLVNLLATLAGAAIGWVAGRAAA